MIELIRTFTGVTRSYGALVTEGGAYRCTDCGTISLTKKEILNHTCSKEEVEWQKKFRNTKTNSAVR